MASKASLFCAPSDWQETNSPSHPPHCTLVYLVLAPYVSAASVQAGEVVADLKPADRHHRTHDGRAGEPVHRAGHHHLYLRRDGHAGVWRRLHRTIKGVAAVRTV